MAKIECHRRGQGVPIGPLPRRGHARAHRLQAVEAGGEIQLTDGIAGLMSEEQLLAYRFSGIRYDCGDKLGYLKAIVALGLKRPEFREEFSAYLKTLS